MTTLTDDEQFQYEAKVSGYGFACFAHLMAFILCTAAALYISPLVQTPYERVTVNKPQNFKFADAQSTESYNAREDPVATAVPAPSAPSPKNEYHSKFATVNPTV
jgi:hypothetical protein